jgi:type I restriction enzyme S subunit
VDEAIRATEDVIEQTRRVKEGLLQELLTKGIGHTRFKKTPIGEIPEGWEVKRLDGLCKIVSGATPYRETSEYFRNGTIPWVKTLDLDGTILFETDEKITELALRETSCRMLPAGTVMCAMYGGFRQIGRTGILGVDGATNQAIAALTIRDKSLIEPKFLNCSLIAGRPRWKTVAASSRKDPNITRQDVCGFRIALPPLKEQTAITDGVGALNETLWKNAAHLESLLHSKQGLLQDLLTGKVRVSTK